MRHVKGLALFLISCLTPYLLTLTHLYSQPCEVFWNFIAFLLLLGSTVGLVKRAAHWGLKLGYPLLALGAVVGYISAYSTVVALGEQWFFRFRHAQLEALVTQIQRTPQIYELAHSGLPFPKLQTGILNDKEIMYLPPGQDSTVKVRGTRTIYSTATTLAQQGLDPAQVEHLREQLQTLGFVSYEVLRDQTILLTLNGSFGQYQGLAYATSATMPDQAQQPQSMWGQLIRWRHLTGHWYVWVARQ